MSGTVISTETNVLFWPDNIKPLLKIFDLESLRGQNRVSRDPPQYTTISVNFSLDLKNINLLLY